MDLFPIFPYVIIYFNTLSSSRYLRSDLCFGLESPQGDRSMNNNEQTHFVQMIEEHTQIVKALLVVVQAKEQNSIMVELFH